MTAQDVHTELFIDGAWVEFTNRTRPVWVISRGARDERSAVTFGTCDLVINNPDGLLSNRNPSSIYYGKLGRNTLVRVRVGSDVRFLGEMAQCRPLADISGRNVVLVIQACGIMRRLTQGAKPLQSALTRNTRIQFVREYWPIEDLTDSTVISSALDGGTPITPVGAMNFATDADLPGSAPLAVPDLGAHFNGLIRPFPADWVPGSDNTAWGISWAMRIPAAPAATINLMAWRGSGTVVAGIISLTAAGNVLIQAYNNAGVELLGDAGTGIGHPYDQWVVWGLTEYQIGPNIKFQIDRWRVSTVSPFDTAFASHNVTIAGAITQPTVVGYTQPMAGIGIGHLSVFTQAIFLDPSAAWGWNGQMAATRMARLCAEESIFFNFVGLANDDTQPMGPQQIKTLMDLLQDCAAADGGILYETRDALGLTYVTRSRLYNQAPALALTYTGKELQPPEPAEDDQSIENDITVSRVGGAKGARAVQQTGPLSILPPPSGVGTYDRGGRTLNVATDDQLPPIADWLLHLGTWDELRYPSLSAKLMGPVWVNDAVLSAAAAALDSGDTLTLAGLPAWLPPDMVQLQVRGYREVLTRSTRDLDWVLAPGWPWEVWEIETGGSTLIATQPAGSTSLRLATSVGPEWSTTATPYHIQIDGEAMTVTAMTTDTPTFIAAGTFASANNASVVPGLPAGMTVDVGQVMLLYAAIRNSGTGTVDTPAGWTPLLAFGNCAWFGRYYITGDTAPTVTFSGGVANADTSARIFGWSGLTLHLDYSATQLNGSVQDIAYPALYVRRPNSVIIYSGWKQDDWTSVATIAGATEDADNPTVTGDDQGIVVDHLIQTTPTNIPAGSFVVAGGAVAISRAMVFALRPRQTATVVRAVNGVSKSLAAGKTVKGWRLGVTAL